MAGGTIGRLIRDSYFWVGINKSRPMQEWALLNQLHSEGFPVPQPAAVNIRRFGMTYRANIITLELPNTETLADRLIQAPLAPEIWQRIGTTIGKFHLAGAYHADLNARNILVDDYNRIYLIDWDRGRLRSSPSAWRWKNVKRLQRSLRKIASFSYLNFSSNDIDAFLAGYNSGKRS
ncbi:3-deoxy-D-manno-octulosonic acid kinase [Alkalilimnicola ehrlichii]|uniref:3-deoxy-D-manno-octulosonic acid kinase n=1 Tax=Alkalilimnicola ehrlichii TaxID=351052 RepID=UPI0015F2967D|nr:3-deoxy-D-manno-octulosonic acid kinase [Alkalilimnicola ehrlichii]